MKTFVSMIGVKPKKPAERKPKSIGIVQIKIMKILREEPWTTTEELLKEHKISTRSNYYMIATPVASLVNRGFIINNNGSLKLTEEGEEYLQKIESGEVKPYKDRHGGVQDTNSESEG